MGSYNLKGNFAKRYMASKVNSGRAEFLRLNNLKTILYRLRVLVLWMFYILSKKLSIISRVK